MLVAFARAATNEGAVQLPCQPADPDHGHARKLKGLGGSPPGNGVSAFEGSSAHVPRIVG